MYIYNRNYKSEITMKDLTTYITESVFKYDKASYSEEKFIEEFK